MSFWGRLFSLPTPIAVPAQEIAPSAAYQDKGGGVLITSTEQLERYLKDGDVSASGAAVTPESAMRVAVVYACVRIRSGVVKNLPTDVMRRLDDRRREEASDHPLWKIFKKRPNRWQSPSEFKQMLETHVQLRGNGYALIVRSRGRVIELVPMAAHRVKVEQLDDLSLVYTYSRRDGRTITLPQSEVFHLRGLTLDGIVGVSPITYAREAIGLAIQTERHGAMLFKNGAVPGLVLEHPQRLGKEGQDLLKASLEEYRGSENAYKSLILEEGMKANTEVGMTSEDAQFLETRKFERTDIGMFYGVPPFMYGDTEKSTSWGAGIEQQKNGFLTFTVEDSLVMWEEAIARDLITEDDIYARFNRNAFLRGDLKARKDFYVAMLQWGVFNPDIVLASEDMNPREDGKGGQYYDPPNTAGGEDKDPEKDDDDPQDSRAQGVSAA